MDYNKPELVSVACQIAKEQLQVVESITKRNRMD